MILRVDLAIRAERRRLLSQVPAPPTNGLPVIDSSSPAASPTHSSLPLPRSRGTYPVVRWLIGHRLQNSGFGAYFGCIFPSKVDFAVKGFLYPICAGFIVASELATAGSTYRTQPGHTSIPAVPTPTSGTPARRLIPVGGSSATPPNP